MPPQVGGEDVSADFGMLPESNEAKAEARRLGREVLGRWEMYRVD